MRAAIALADARGREELTMRKLAKELGVEAMSLYNHVANKDDLLDGMIDIVFGEIDAPDGRRRLEGRAAQAGRLDPRGPEPPPLGDRRDGGPDHPRARQPPPPRRRPRLPARRRLLDRDDRPRHTRSRTPTSTASPCSRATCRSQTPEDFAAEAQRQMATTPTRWPTTPTSSRSSAATSPKAGYDYDSEFLFGLDVILDRLEQLLGQR